MADAGLEVGFLLRHQFGLALGFFQRQGLHHLLGHIQPDAVEDHAAIAFHVGVGAGLDPAGDAVGHAHRDIEVHRGERLCAVLEVLPRRGGGVGVVVLDDLGHRAGLGVLVLAGAHAHELGPLGADEGQPPRAIGCHAHLEHRARQGAGQLQQLVGQQLVVLVLDQGLLQLLGLLQRLAETLQGPCHGADLVLPVLVGDGRVVLLPAHALHAACQPPDGARHMQPGDPGGAGAQQQQAQPASPGGLADGLGRVHRHLLRALGQHMLGIHAQGLDLGVQQGNCRVQAQGQALQGLVAVPVQGLFDDAAGDCKAVARLHQHGIQAELIARQGRVQAVQGALERLLGLVKLLGAGLRLPGARGPQAGMHQAGGVGQVLAHLADLVRHQDLLVQQGVVLALDALHVPCGIQRDDARYRTQASDQGNDFGSQAGKGKLHGQGRGMGGWNRAAGRMGLKYGRHSLA